MKAEGKLNVKPQTKQSIAVIAQCDRDDLCYAGKRARETDSEKMARSNLLELLLVGCRPVR